MLRCARLVGSGEVIAAAFARVRKWLLANALLLTGALAALFFAGFVIQTIRIEGLRVSLPMIGTIGPKGLRAENAGLLADLDRMTARRDAALAASKRITAANAAATRKANADETRNLETERAHVERFIAAGGVRRCPAPRADAVAQGGSPGFDAGAGPLPELHDVQQLVTVEPEDVRICVENTVKAQAWRDWGLAIEANQSARD